MDRQPRLVGSLVELRPATSDDWSSLYGVAQDPLIWEVHPAHDRWQEPVFRAFFEEGLASGGMLVARDRATGGVIGSSRYDQRRVDPDEIEIGWTFLARSRWGGHHNGEMKRLMLDHAFRFAPRVILIVGEGNLRSRRAVEKIGGRLTDRRLDAPMARRSAPHVVYAIECPDAA